MLQPNLKARTKMSLIVASMMLALASCGWLESKKSQKSEPGKSIDHELPADNQSAGQAQNKAEESAPKSPETREQTSDMPPEWEQSPDIVFPYSQLTKLAENGIAPNIIKVYFDDFAIGKTNYDKSLFNIDGSFKKHGRIKVAIKSSSGKIFAAYLSDELTELRKLDGDFILLTGEIDVSSSHTEDNLKTIYVVRISDGATRMIFSEPLKNFSADNNLDINSVLVGNQNHKQYFYYILGDGSYRRTFYEVEVDFKKPDVKKRELSDEDRGGAEIYRLARGFIHATYINNRLYNTAGNTYLDGSIENGSRVSKEGFPKEYLSKSNSIHYEQVFGDKILARVWSDKQNYEDAKTHKLLLIDPAQDRVISELTVEGKSNEEYLTFSATNFAAVVRQNRKEICKLFLKSGQLVNNCVNHESVTSEAPSTGEIVHHVYDARIYGSIVHLYNHRTYENGTNHPYPFMLSRANRAGFDFSKDFPEYSARESERRHEDQTLIERLSYIQVK